MSSQRYYSNIYWHFTGSPKGIDWRDVRCPADIKKQGPVLVPSDASIALNSILGSRKLLGSCIERVVTGLETAKFCCVTDIPIKDLPSHAPYYGNFAIGFKAEAIHRTFLPVMYVPTQSMPVVEKMVPNPRLTEMALDSLRYQGAFQEQQAARLLSLAAHQKEVVKEPDREALQGFLMNFVKVTKFDVSPENTFYREREWRNIGDFSFAFDDVAAVVVPASFLPRTRDFLDKEGYPRSISLIAWEFVENA